MKRLVFQLSVRAFVEFLLRSGDIDNRISSHDQLEAMQEGAKLHRKIQARMGGNYTAEFPLSITYEYEDYDIAIDGRADGIIDEDGEYLIDEIKTGYYDVLHMTEPIPVHLAQAKVYAYIYAGEYGLSSIGVQMTYARLNTERDRGQEEINRFRQTYSYEELEEWFEDLLNQYCRWTDYLSDWRKLRQASIKDLEFPFDYRPGQKDLASDVYRSIARQKMLFLQAPTGVGKTISTLYPAIKAMGEDMGERIFYLTAKTVTATVAQETYGILKEHGLQMKVVQLTAKEKMCVCDDMDCNPTHCQRAKGHFDRVNQAVFDMLTHETSFHRDDILSYAEKHDVCPFEMSLDLTNWTDGIICDYNYVFDPQARLKRYFSEGQKGDYIFLVDEVHNLVDRGRDMYSAELYKEDFLAIKKLMKEAGPNIAKACEKCNKKLLEFKRQCQDYTYLEDLGTLTYDLYRLSAQIDKFLRNNQGFQGRPELLEFYFNLRSFLMILEMVDDHYVIYTEHTGDGGFKVKLFCVDPSHNLQQCFDQGRAAVLFSATLLPVNYYKSLLSTRADNYAIYANTSFTEDQKLLMVARDVSSKYTRRNREEYSRVAAYLSQMVAAKKGNYIAFFPSYKVMEEVEDCFEELGVNGVEILCQDSNMSQTEREEFLEYFRRDRANSLLAFCVMGGIFGEGIDLKEESLIGAAIYGTGIPQISNEREILKQYYDGRGLKGFDYAYRYPGMNKVLQAGGRVIRTARDRGIILLMDERFLQRDNLKLFPREWENYKIVNKENAGSHMGDFWQKNS